MRVDIRALALADFSALRRESEEKAVYLLQSLLLDEKACRLRVAWLRKAVQQVRGRFPALAPRPRPEFLSRVLAAVDDPGLIIAWREGKVTFAELEAMTRAPRALYEAHCRLLGCEPEPWDGEEEALITETEGELLFSSEYLDKAECVFLSPGNRYSWEEIVSGAPVLTAQGRRRRMSAVERNTFRGFHRVNKNCPGVQESFRGYFIEQKSVLVEALSQVQTREELHQVENRLTEAVRARLCNVMPAQLESYNKVRKPIDLYVMHLVAMAVELDAHRAALVPLLFLPLDSQILQHPELFTDEELANCGLSRASTYKDVTTETTYRALQQLLLQRAATVATRLGRPFHPVYFDLVWNNRYRNWGGNLFETNP